MEIKLSHLAKFLNEKKFNYWGISLKEEIEFVEKRIISIKIKKHLTISLDCDFNYTMIGEFIQCVLDYIEQYHDVNSFTNIITKFL